MLSNSQRQIESMTEVDEEGELGDKLFKRHCASVWASENILKVDDGGDGVTI